VAVLYILSATRRIAFCTTLLVSVVMLPYRNSANLTSGHALPPTTSGSVGGTRPLSLVTNQQPFRSTTAQTFETESPQSETSPQETPPMPLRPPSSPYLPPGSSGLRRQSTRRPTYETYSSAPDEYDPVPSQPPNIMHMPTPALPYTPGPRSPIQPQQPAPGGGAAGFPASPLPHHGSSRDYSHHNTADYTYRFDTMPSPRSDSGPPHYESADISGGIHANVWPTYNKISQEFDEKRLVKWNTDLDVLLIFVSLMVEGDRCNSDRTDATYRPPCSLPSLPPSSSGRSTTWNQITNNSRPYSFTSC